MINTPLIMIK